MSNAPKYVKNGSDLAEALSLPVAEGRFHVDGIFYKQPSTYPCAFFDKRGKLIIESEAALEKISQISKGRVNFRRPISKQLGCQFVENSPDWPELAAAHAVKKARKPKAVKLLATLSDKEKHQLIDRLK